MRFLTYMVKESLYLYPLIPLSNRKVVKTIILLVGGGYNGISLIIVRKGEIVVFFVIC